MSTRRPARAEPPPDNRLRTSLREAFERVPGAWRPVVDGFAASPTGHALTEYVDRRVATGATVYPATPFRALETVAPDAVRVVILGQDPYHGAGQAQGLAFSVAPGQKPPPSLRNLLKEVQTDLGRASICRDDLTPWAEQGVLLLNTVLTVEDGAPQSHAGRGWETLTDALLGCVAGSVHPVAFLLWGAPAQRKRPLVERAHHRVLASSHPSPLSATRPPTPFVGSRPFSRVNAFLSERRPGSPPIRW